MATRQIIDISLPVHPGMPTYPGNQVTEFTEHVKPSGSRLTSIVFDTHAGTHIDAPRHSLGDTKDVSAFALESFYGLCRVIECQDQTVTRAFLEERQPQKGERLLIKTTNSQRGFDTFYDDWVAIDGNGAEYLAEKNVALVGIDWFGVKSKNAADNRAHTSLLERTIPILEGIDLSKVDEGTYILSAFPVRFVGTDGAHTRAVLIKEE